MTKESNQTQVTGDLELSVSTSESIPECTSGSTSECIQEDTSESTPQITTEVEPQLLLVTVEKNVSIEGVCIIMK